MNNYAPRISRPYEDISGGLSEWSDLVERFIVAEHDPDQGCSKTHVHIAIWNSPVKHEALKRMFKKKTELQLSGNKDWAWVHEDYPEGLPDWVDDTFMSKAYEENFKYLKYIIKGDLSRVKFVKNISQEILEEAAKAWVNKRHEPLEVTIIEKRVKPPPYQQAVIADAAADWYNHKRKCKENNELVNDSDVIEFVCEAMRKQSKGINPHMVRDLSYAVLYDDLEYKSVILAKCRKFFLS